MHSNDAPAVEGRRSSRITRLVVIVLPLVIIAAVAYPALRTPLEWREGGALVRTVGDAQPKATVTVPLTFREGGDVSHEGSHIFDILSQVPGVARVKLTPAPPSVEVSFDPARATERSIRDALAASGYAGSEQ